MTNTEIESLRQMILSAMLRMHPAPGELGIVLVGSLAQGLGNSLSDIDVIAIDFDATRQLAPLTKYAHIGGRRFEAFFVGPGDLRDLAHQFEVEPKAYDAWGMSGLYFRIAYGLPLHNDAEVQRVTAAFSKARSSEILSAVHERGALNALNETCVLTQLQLHADAAAALRRGIGHHLKRLVCGSKRYAVTGSKYLQVQLSRCAEEEEYSALLELWRTRLPSNPADYVETGLTELIRAGYAIDRDSATKIRLVDGVDCTRLVTKPGVRHGKEIFLVNPACENAVAAFCGAGEHELGSFLPADMLGVAQAFYRYGLATIEQGARTYAASACRSEPARLLDLGAEGPAWPEGSDDVLTSLDTSFEEMVELCCCIFEQAIIYSNSKEDVVGAIRALQWSQVEVKLRDMMTAVGVIALANRGLLSRDATSTGDVSILHCLVKDAALSAFGECFRDLMQLKIDGKESARVAIALIEKSVQRLPSHVLADAGRCMEDGRLYRAIVLDLGAKLAELSRKIGGSSAAFEGSRFDNVATSDATEGDALSWFRRDDMSEELMKI